MITSTKSLLKIAIVDRLFVTILQKEHATLFQIGRGCAYICLRIANSASLMQTTFCVNEKKEGKGGRKRHKEREMEGDHSD